MAVEAEIQQLALVMDGRVFLPALRVLYQFFCAPVALISSFTILSQFLNQKPLSSGIILSLPYA